MPSPSRPAIIPDRLLSLRQVAEYLSVNPRTVTKWLEAKRFPRPLRLGGKRRSMLRWRLSTIDHYLQGVANG
jgi:excisionase family DNA binding protein